MASRLARLGILETTGRDPAMPAINSRAIPGSPMVLETGGTIDLPTLLGRTGRTGLVSTLVRTVEAPSPLPANLLGPQDRIPPGGTGMAHHQSGSLVRLGSVHSHLCETLDLLEIRESSLPRRDQSRLRSQLTCKIPPSILIARACSRR